ncbi:unnamed protein product [Amaranthus hypochondriacus]
MSEEGNKVVCVTGASGYIASWIVKLLLHHHYTVHATVRDPNDERKVGHLKMLEGAEERLKVFKADLMEEGSFDSAISGCHGVFHTASPVTFTFNDPQGEILDPAMKGTLNVLTSCKKFPSVRRVVLTSSIAAVIFNGKPRDPHVVVDETWFSNPQFCGDSNMKWYRISKTLAEEAAWKFVKEHGIDMVSINPSAVIGPMLQPRLASSVALILNLINGAETFANATFGWVNVKDVATAHILAFEVPSASGRYVLVENVAHCSEIVKILQELYPKLTLPNRCEDNEPFVPKFQVSTERAKSLGINFIPLKLSLKETVENLKERGYVRF